MNLNRIPGKHVATWRKISDEFSNVLGSSIENFLGGTHEVSCWKQAEVGGPPRLKLLPVVAGMALFTFFLVRFYYATDLMCVCKKKFDLWTLFGIRF